MGQSHRKGGGGAVEWGCSITTLHGPKDNIGGGRPSKLRHLPSIPTDGVENRRHVGSTNQPSLPQNETMANKSGGQHTPREVNPVNNESERRTLGCNSMLHCTSSGMNDSLLLSLFFTAIRSARLLFHFNIADSEY